MPKSVVEQYPELMHYTSAAGLAGILSSGCLWATHAAFLNDAQELTHFFDARLPKLAYDAIANHVASQATLKQNKKIIQRRGGVKAISTADAEKITSLLRKATLPFNTPFVFSLSAPASQKVAHSGLLSQWRGYGTDGGYCIVFDTVRFGELLEAEGERYNYQFAQWGDVYYYSESFESQPSSEEVEEYERTVATGIVALVRGDHPETVDGLYSAITSLSCLYKHWGFQEEREVRIIAIPPKSDLAQMAAMNGDSRPVREQKAFVRAGTPIPYIELLSGLSGHGGEGMLPIKKVIVGPHREKERRVEAVRHLLRSSGYEVEVSCSEIPYIGQ